jgi:hypothetical protein
MEVEAVHVHDVNRPTTERALDRAAVCGVRAAADGFRDRSGRPRRGDQRAGRAGALAGDHDGNMAGPH